MIGAERKNLAIRRQIGRTDLIALAVGGLRGYMGSTMCSAPADPARSLLVDGRPVGPLAVASTRSARTRGLLGRDHLDGALLLPSTRSVHTFAMRFPIDVALCAGDLSVIAVRTLGPGRLVLPRPGVRAVLEAEAGAFARWDLVPGSRLAIGRPR